MSQFISYAQNFEDVMLWRALKHIEKGFYVDVGANDPKLDSVTQAFYERGWRGINIEPMQSYFEKLQRDRIHDINLPYAAGEKEGEITFYEVPETGLSTTLPKFAQAAKNDGRTITEKSVHVIPLNEILNQYAHESIHFMKIDVEGAEASVIRGLDLSKWRPWILIIEVTIPNSPEVMSDEWEYLILDAGYQSIYFDGLNRYYIAKEHSKLAEVFSTPPNVFDEFVPYQQAWAHREIYHLQQVITSMDNLRPDLEWTRGELEVLRKELSINREDRQCLLSQVKETEKKRSELEWQLKDLEILRKELFDTRGERDNLRNQLRKTQEDLNGVRAQAEEFKLQYVNILYSQSYRITAPLRSILMFIYRLRRSVSKQTPDQNVSIPSRVTDKTDIGLSKQDIRYFDNLLQREIDKRRKK